MASRRVEDDHISRINKILSTVGLECIRTPSLSDEISLMSPISDDIGPVLEEEAPTIVPKPSEVSIEEEEEVVEEEDLAFPTPSLRRMLTDKQRKIEEHNRIHVLPEIFKTKFDSADIPKIATTAQQKYIDIIAEMLGCTKYKSSLAEYWFLDTMANLLKRAQDDELEKPTQKVLMLWFCEWMKEIQHFDAADRPRMLRRFKDIMLSAGRYVATESCLPAPEQAGVRYLPLELEDSPRKAPTTTPEATPATITFDNTAYACSLRDMLKIMHYIFDLFSTDYQFDLVRSIFTFSPDYYCIDTPYQMQVPKKMYAPLKPKAKKEKAKKEPKSKAAAGKPRKQEPDTADYLALLELKAKEEKQLDEEEEVAREAWNQQSHILPLILAATSELFDKYWPPPTPDPPEPEADAKPKKKKKG